jgi:hypothetical protein
LVAPLAAGNLWACPWWDQTLASIGTARPKTGGVELTYTESSGRKTGSILAPPSKQIRKADQATAASNLDTLLGRGNDREVRMLLSFQRPSHLFGRAFLPGARPEPSAIPERTGEYSARIVARRDAWI